MEYLPGLHILSEIISDETDLLKDYQGIKNLFNEKISAYGLDKLGEVYHSFPDAGYTGVICLTESHIAIHTWPEFGIITFDVYLSNFLKNNDEVTRRLFEDTIAFYKSKKYTRKEVRR